MTPRDEALFEGPATTLLALLAAREERVARRAALLRQGGVVIGFSAVMPGPVKDCAVSQAAARVADVALRQAFAAPEWHARKAYHGVTAMGPEALWLVEGDARDAKRLTVAIEERHPLGRLFDLDVETREGALGRASLGLGPRQCLVCGSPARECGRSQRHALDEVRAAMTTLYLAWEAPA